MYSLVNTQRFVFIPPIISTLESNPLDREKILDRLRRAVRLCNMIMTGKKVPCFHPTNRSLSVEENGQVKSGMIHLSFMLENSVKWLRTIDFDIDCFCDCETTTGCLHAIGIHTLWDIVDSKGDDYLGGLSFAENIAGAQRQYHLRALVERPAVDYQ
ncbi:MAG: hypothetical protein WCK60_01460 [Candidatus Nomurabacteria bacterium]